MNDHSAPITGRAWPWWLRPGSWPFWWRETRPPRLAQRSAALADHLDHRILLSTIARTLHVHPATSHLPWPDRDDLTDEIVAAITLWHDPTWNAEADR